MPTKVLLADDVALIRRSLRRMLEGDPDVCIVGEVAGLPSLEPALKESSPEILVLDLNLGSNVKTLIRKLKDANPKLRIVIITAFAGRTDELMADAVLDKMSLGTELLALVKKLGQQL